MLILQQISAGGDRNFGYIIACTRTGIGAVADPSMDAESIIAYINRYNLDIKYLFNTHSHYDHVTENGKILDMGAEKVSGKGSVSVGDWKVEIIPTPGHTEDSICLHVESHIITGDTLFVGKVGGTADEKSAELEFRSLRALMDLPQDTKVWPGHNYGAKAMSTIGEERSDNPFCQRLDSIENFMWMKSNWGSYKKDNYLI